MNAYTTLHSALSLQKRFPTLFIGGTQISFEGGPQCLECTKCVGFTTTPKTYVCGFGCKGRAALCGVERLLTGFCGFAGIGTLPVENREKRRFDSDVVKKKHQHVYVVM